jgi:hypothetical protein
VRHLDLIKRGLIFCLLSTFSPMAAPAEEQLPHPETYVPSSQGKQAKEMFDDPSDLFVTHPFKDVLPPEVYDRITFDQEKMKKGWAELVGFTAPELVGKIAPEIKPGKYTCADLEKYPGLKELIPQEVTSQ